MHWETILFNMDGFVLLKHIVESLAVACHYFDINNLVQG